MNIGFNCIVREQSRLLESILQKNDGVYRVISALNQFEIPNAYVAAGCISQTVWNYQDGKPLSSGISDIDVIYYNENDLSSESESEIEAKLTAYFDNICYRIDVTNEARTHLWYKEKFGIAIPPYTSSEEAINSWIPATAVGVKYERGEFCVYAPYGMNDMFGQILRPNKLLASKEHYLNKSAKWKQKWHNIYIIDW